MLIDLTYKVTTYTNKLGADKKQKVPFGHLGTHFDVMNKEFPLSFVKREAVVFNVDGIIERDIESSDIDMSLVQEDMFVAFKSGYIETVEYGTKLYFKNHPQLSNELIDRLLDLKVSIIGIDFAGVRRGTEHTPMDQHCADRGVFIIENLCNFGELLGDNKSMTFVVNTYPINFAYMTGLPCRVVAEV